MTSTPRKKKASKKASKKAGKKVSKKASSSAGKQLYQVTSHEVATLAGVSRAAVSRAFTPDASISEGMRRRVMAAADKLGYQPNVLARSLIKRTSNLIGLIMADWENPFYTALLRGFSERLSNSGYEVMLLTSSTQEEIDNSVRRLRQYQAAGIIFVSAYPSAKVSLDCINAGIRTVVLNRDDGGLPIKSVTCNHQQIGIDISNAVISAGYSKVALIRGNPAVKSGIIRSTAIKTALAQNKTTKVVADYTDMMGYEAGRAALIKLMYQPNKPDVIVCSSDITAIGVLDAARLDLGLKVPDKLGVIGFGDSPLASMGSYDLATIRLPIEQMLDSAVAGVLGQDEDEPIATFNADVIFRSTLRKPNFT